MTFLTASLVLDFLSSLGKGSPPRPVGSFTSSRLTFGVKRVYTLPYNLFEPSDMPHSNGDAINGTVASDLVRGAKVLDYTKAVEILEAECQERDGLDVHTLIDSKRNGGLTYNDFLVLPGYIGTNSTLHVDERAGAHRLYRLPCFQCDSRHSSHEENLHQNSIPFVAHGHGHRTLDGNSHGVAWRSRCDPSQLLDRGPG